MSRSSSGPAFVRLFRPVLDTLRDLGGSGRPKEISATVAARIRLPEEELNRANKNGQSHFANQVAWARFYLAKAGLIDTSRRGVWAVTEPGRAARPDKAESVAIFQRAARTFRERAGERPAEDEEIPPDDRSFGDDSFRRDMSKILRSLSPRGFERLCQRILREVGFEEVIVTGRSGDGGIDGHGTLRINRLVSDRVLFQCKRHADRISPNYIREFRGSMNGRADRGIFLATSNFSAEAKREATRDGAVPIEMVDLDALISFLAELQLGVISRTAFAVDELFFREFMPEQKSEAQRSSSQTGD